jgi:hypothetical protein
MCDNAISKKKIMLLMFLLVIPIGVRGAEIPRENQTLGNISSPCCFISTLYCSDNQTLVQQWDINGVYTYALKDCGYLGCDNTTSSCNAPLYQQDMINLLIVIIIILGIIVLYKVFK